MEDVRILGRRVADQKRRDPTIKVRVADKKRRLADVNVRNTDKKRRLADVNVRDADQKWRAWPLMSATRTRSGAIRPLRSAS